MRLIEHLKNSLSHVKETRLDYKLVEYIWGESASRGKACSYYWVKIPSSVLFLILAIVLASAVTAIGWFFGHIPTWFETEDPYLTNYIKVRREKAAFYPYRYTSKGKRMHIVPWQVVTGLGVLGILYYLSIRNQDAGSEVGIVAGVVVAAFVGLAVLCFLIVMLWQNSFTAGIRNRIGDTWDKACPPLVIEKHEVEQAVEN